jgi:hypothetical protein
MEFDETQSGGRQSLPFSNNPLFEFQVYSFLFQTSILFFSVFLPEAIITSDLTVHEESNFPIISLILENAKREQSLLPLLS